MGRKLLYFGISILVVISLLSIASANPGIPQAFYGDVIVGTSKAPDNTIVIAAIQNIEYARTTTSNGQYIFNLPSDDPGTVQKEGGVDGDTVILYVNGVEAGKSSFKSGDIKEMKFSLSSAAASQSKVDASPVKSNAGSSDLDSPANPPPAPPAPPGLPAGAPDAAPAEVDSTHVIPDETVQIKEGSIVYGLIGLTLSIVLILIYFIKYRK